MLFTLDTWAFVLDQGIEKVMHRRELFFEFFALATQHPLWPGPPMSMSVWQLKTGELTSADANLYAKTVRILEEFEPALAIARAGGEPLRLALLANKNKEVLPMPTGENFSVTIIASVLQASSEQNAPIDSIKALYEYMRDTTFYTKGGIPWQYIASKGAVANFWRHGPPGYQPWREVSEQAVPNARD